MERKYKQIHKNWSILCIIKCWGQRQISYKIFLRNKTGEIVASITRTSTAHPGTDTTSRDFIVGLSVFNSVYVSSKPAVAFSIARDSPTYGFLDPVTFNVQLVNEGSHYGSSHRFTAPLDGIYYFSISVGLSSGQTANFTLYKNYKPLANIVRLSTVHNGSDTISRSIMTSLKKDDTIHGVNQENRYVWSSSSLETSFSGFLYEPANGYPVRFFVNEIYQFVEYAISVSNIVLYSFICCRFLGVLPELVT